MLITRGSFTVQLVSSLTGLDLVVAVLTNILIFSCLIKSNPVKLESNWTILPRRVFSVNKSKQVGTLIPALQNQFGFQRQPMNYKGCIYWELLNSLQVVEIRWVQFKNLKGSYLDFVHLQFDVSFVILAKIKPHLICSFYRCLPTYTLTCLYLRWDNYGTLWNVFHPR